MWPYLTERFGNLSSTSPYGKVARDAVELAREQVATLIGAHPDEITFTSGGDRVQQPGHLRRRLNPRASGRGHLGGGTPRYLPAARPHRGRRLDGPPTAGGSGRTGRSGRGADGPDRDGHRDPRPERNRHRTAGRRDRRTGTCRRRSDAHRRRPGGRQDPGATYEPRVDLLSIAGHKLYAAKGVGALYVRRGAIIGPLVVGAGQEGGLRAGTENVASIVGLGKAAQLALDDLGTEPERRRHSVRPGRQLAEHIPGLVRVSPAEGCLPNTLMVALPDRLGASLLDAAPRMQPPPEARAIPACTPQPPPCSPWASSPASPWVPSDSPSAEGPPTTKSTPQQQPSSRAGTQSPKPASSRAYRCKSDC